MLENIFIDVFAEYIEFNSASNILHIFFSTEEDRYLDCTLLEGYTDDVKSVELFNDGYSIVFYPTEIVFSVSNIYYGVYSNNYEKL